FSRDWSSDVCSSDLQAGAADQIADAALVFKLHLFLGLTIFLIFPFTRLAHVLSGFFAPVRYLFLRPGYQLVRSRRQRSLADRRGAYDAKQGDRKSTRLNSSHVKISYAV